MTDEELLYNYYLQRNITDRNEAVQALSERKFEELYRTYWHWVRSTEKIVELRYSTLPELIHELQEIWDKILPNESTQFLETKVNEIDEDEFRIVSRLYAIEDEKKCAEFAKTSTRQALWYLKYQPTGKQAIMLTKRLEELSKLNNN